MQTSAFFVAVVVLCERAVAGGAFNFQHLYRATGPFVSMHTGGQHIDAFWALALPFLFLPSARAKWLSWLARASLLGPLPICNRGDNVARRDRAGRTGNGHFVTTVHFHCSGRSPGQRQTYVFGVARCCWSLPPGIAVLWDSPPIKSRFVESEIDLKTRWNEWNELCRAAEHDWATTAFGNGLGTVPSIASSAFGDPVRPAELINLPDGRVALRLRPGKAVYVEQVVDRHAPGPWTLAGHVRRRGTASLSADVCEKTLFDSFRCLEAGFAVPGQPDTWQPIAWAINIDALSTRKQLLA